jgi:hypothetical protein
MRLALSYLAETSWKEDELEGRRAGRKTSWKEDELEGRRAGRK